MAKNDELASIRKELKNAFSVRTGKSASKKTISKSNDSTPPGGRQGGRGQ